MLALHFNGVFHRSRLLLHVCVVCDRGSEIGGIPTRGHRDVCGLGIKIYAVMSVREGRCGPTNLKRQLNKAIIIRSPERITRRCMAHRRRSLELDVCCGISNSYLKCVFLSLSMIYQKIEPAYQVWFPINVYVQAVSFRSMA